MSDQLHGNAPPHDGGPRPGKSRATKPTATKQFDGVIVSQAAATCGARQAVAW